MGSWQQGPVSKKSLLVHHTEKICSKFGEDQSINLATILFADTGHRRPYTPGDYILSNSAMHCSGQTTMQISSKNHPLNCHTNQWTVHVHEHVLFTGCSLFTFHRKYWFASAQL